MDFECPRCKETASAVNETGDKQGVHFQCPKCRAEFVVSYDALNGPKEAPPDPKVKSKASG